MSVPVSMCLIRFEISNSDSTTSLDVNTEDCTGSTDKVKMASSQTKYRMRRNVREYTVETYASDQSQVQTLFPGSSLKAEAGNSSSGLSMCSTHEHEDLKAHDRPYDQIHFVSGNPFVEVTKGILHLYKENELTTMDHAATRSQTVCILAVPASMTCHDLMTFVASCQADIKHVRIIRDGSPNQYMALLTFRSKESALSFYMSFSGMPFNTLEPSCCCNLVFVSHVEIIEREGEGLPPSSHTELPTCPVCLERMDESVDGILTILCNHAFHGNCLTKWGDTTCPVCRYVQTPEVVADNRCMECDCAESLWICLICGHVGCGRYEQGHAFQHYIETQHCYSMQLGNNRVWDYVGDNFVHRLLQNKADGKLVEGNSPGDKNDEKLDSLQLEFTYLLTSQLNSQRVYFEDMLARLEQQTIDETSEIKNKLAELSELNNTLKEKTKHLLQEKQSNEKKLNQLSARLNQATASLTEERQINSVMRENQVQWQNKCKSLEEKFQHFKSEKEKEIIELKEQLRDVMFYLEANKQVESSELKDEIAQGQIVLGEPSSSTNKPTRRRRKR